MAIYGHKGPGLAGGKTVQGLGCPGLARARFPLQEHGAGLGGDAQEVGKHFLHGPGRAHQPLQLFPGGDLAAYPQAAGLAVPFPRVGPGGQLLGHQSGGEAQEGRFCLRGPVKAGQEPAFRGPGVPHGKGPGDPLRGLGAGPG